MDWTDLWQAVGQILSGLLLGLALFVWQKFLAWRKKKMSLQVTLNQNLKIKDVLTEIRAYYDADRVKLFQFHNGEHYVSGSSIMKVSLTHYVLGRGVGAPAGAETDLQNIPVGYLDTCVTNLMQNSHIFAEIADFPDTCYLTGIFRKNGTEQILSRAIYNRKKEILGFMVVSWLEPLTLTKDQLAMSKELAALISDELAFRW